jgi:integrase
VNDAKGEIIKFTTHDVRASAATSDAMKGYPNKYIASRCGHSQVNSVEPYLSFINK